MGFFDKISGGGQIPASEKSADVQITPKGVEKIEKGLINGVLFDVLVTVKKNQPCNVQEVTRELNREERKVRYWMRCLEKDRLIQVV